MNHEHELKMQATHEIFWEWLQDNADAIFTFDPAPRKLHIGRGVIGNPKRLRGKPYQSRDLHPAFVAYLETPDAIKIGHKVFTELHETYRLWYTYAVLRARGVTHRNMEEYFGLEKVSRKDGGASDKASRWANQIMRRFFRELPPELVAQWADEEIQDYVAAPMAKRLRDTDRVQCPACGGTGWGECRLCRTRKKEDYDGMVYYNRARWYHRKVSRGEWEERPIDK